MIQHRFVVAIKTFSETVPSMLNRFVLCTSSIYVMDVKLKKIATTIEEQMGDIDVFVCMPVNFFWLYF